MELRQLRAFLQVATVRHFGRAAKLLKITQPALTQRIQALERELQVQLLTRSAREVQLTAAGTVLLPYAENLVQVEDRALRDLADHAAGRAGQLRLAYLSSGDAGSQGKIVSEFRRRYPSINVKTSTGHSESNIERVHAGDIDCAFVALPVRLPEAVVVHPIGRYPMVLALPADHRLVKMTTVPATELRGEPIIMSPPQLNSVLIAALMRWITRRSGEPPNLVAEEPPDQAVEAVANSASAVALVPRSTSSPDSRVVFRPLDPAPLLELSLAHLRNDPSPVMRNLLKIVDEVGPASLAAETGRGELI